MEILSINSKIDRIHLIQSTISQIRKDFADDLTNIPLRFDENTIYQQLTSSLSGIITELMSEDRMKFKAILYRVDIGESQISAVIGCTDASTKIAELVIEREFKKVITREYFKNQR